MNKIKFKPKKLICVNCSNEIPWTRVIKLYCSDICKEEAKYIRYYRSCIRDGRIKKSDINEILRIRLAHLNSGGYSRLDRKISIDIRNIIIKRNNSKCQICGKIGTEIDHIKGDNNDLENLQLLCRKCHIKKSLANIKTINPNDENYNEILNKNRILELRAHNKTPLLICDDEINWNKKRKDLIKERKITFLKSLVPIIINLNGCNQRELISYFDFNKIPTFSGHGKWSKKSIREILELII